MEKNSYKKIIIISIVSFIIIVGVIYGIFSLLKKAEKPPLFDNLMTEEEMIIKKQAEEFEKLMKESTPLSEEQIQEQANEFKELMEKSKPLSGAQLLKQAEEFMNLMNQKK